MPSARDRSGLEIHGYVGCVFAWRVRLAAVEKGVPYDWIPCDVAEPDPRAHARNPHEHSPLLYHAGLSLLESEVQMAYIDEVFEGRPLAPETPEARAILRLLGLELRGVDVHGEPSRPVARRKLGPVLALLESVLTTGDLGEGRRLSVRSEDDGPRDFLHGALPGMVDFLVWPFLFHSAGRGLIDSKSVPAVTAYLARAAHRPSFAATRPPWAAAP